MNVPDPDIYHMHTIDVYDLSMKTRNALVRSGMGNAELVRHTPDIKLLTLRNFGRISLAEVRKFIPYEPLPVNRERHICPTCHGTGVVELEQAVSPMRSITSLWRDFPERSKYIFLASLHPRLSQRPNSVDLGRQLGITPQRVRQLFYWGEHKLYVNVYDPVVNKGKAVLTLNDEDMSLWRDVIKPHLDKRRDYYERG